MESAVPVRAPEAGWDRHGSRTAGPHPSDGGLLIAELADMFGFTEDEFCAMSADYCGPAPRQVAAQGSLDYWGDDRGALRFLWQFLEPGMVFFDLGAFHGIFSVLAGKKLSSRGQVVAFEPSPRERRRFQLHLRINGLRGVQLEPYAVSGRTDKLTFFTVAPELGTMNSLKPPPVQVPVRESVVEAVSLDEYLLSRHIERMDLMKIDVEGGELEAFCGARRLLESIRPIVICEVLDGVTRSWGYPARDIVNHLSRYEYVWFDSRDDGSLSPHAHRQEYPEVRNYVAVPREKLPLIARWCAA